MKKRIVLIVLLIAATTVMAFASDRVTFTGTNFSDSNGNPAITVNWVEYGWTGGYVNYTVTGDVESMKIKLTLTYKSAFSLGGTASTTYSNTERLITKGKTYTASFSVSGNLTVVSAVVSVEDLVMKKK